MHWQAHGHALPGGYSSRPGCPAWGCVPHDRTAQKRQPMAVTEEEAAGGCPGLMQGSTAAAHEARASPS
jgi:hypothetical protein